MEEITSNVPVMQFCEYCWATLKEDDRCPDDECAHNLIIDVLASTEEN